MYQSYNNTFFHNNFFGDSNVLIGYGDNSTNFWDNWVEGNYWNNYTGVDANLDGLGDTPHVINSTNRDNHPLMGPLYRYNILPNSDVTIVSNSSITDVEYLQSNSTILLQVSNMTADQTVGFCRISIPHTLINPYNGSISVVIDDGQTPVLFLNNTLYDDGTNRWMYFTYPQSTHSVRIISAVPEFSAFLLLALFMVGTFVLMAVYKKRHGSMTA